MPLCGSLCQPNKTNVVCRDVWDRYKSHGCRSVDFELFVVVTRKGAKVNVSGK